MNKFWLGVVLLLVTGVGTAHADIDARIYWGKRIDMGVPVSGVVASVPVATGMRVGKGDKLLELEQTPFKTALIEAKAGVTQASGARKEARRDYDQTKDLYDRGLISTVELQNAQLKKEAKEAAYSAARAKLERAQYELSHSGRHSMTLCWTSGWKQDKRLSVHNRFKPCLPLLQRVTTSRVVWLPVKRLKTCPSVRRRRSRRTENLFPGKSAHWALSRLPAPSRTTRNTKYRFAFTAAMFCSAQVRKPT